MSTLLHLPFNRELVAPDVIYDQSGHGLIGTRYGAPTLSAAQKKYGNASLQLGVSTANKVGFGELPEWALGGSPFGIALWVYPTAYNSTGGRIASAGGGVVAWNSTTGIHWLLQVNATGIGFTWWTGSAASGMTVVTDLNTWTHIEFDYNGSNVYSFKNGVAFSSVATTASAPSSTPSLYLGAINGEVDTSTTVYSGYIDDMVIDRGSVLHASDFAPGEFAYTPRSIVAARSRELLVQHAYDVPSASMRRERAVRGSYPLYYNGRGRILSTVKRKASPANLPVARRVRLHEQLTGGFVGETWSDSAGNYVFEYIDPACKYYAAAFDHTGEYRGTIADDLTPELM